MSNVPEQASLIAWAQGVEAYALLRADLERHRVAWPGSLAHFVECLAVYTRGLAQLEAEASGVEASTDEAHELPADLRDRFKVIQQQFIGITSLSFDELLQFAILVNELGRDLAKACATDPKP